MQTDVCQNDFRLSINSATPYMAKQHIIYLYTLHKRHWFFVRWFMRLFKDKKVAGIFLDEEINKLDVDRVDKKTKKLAEKAAKLLRKAIEFEKELIEVKTYHYINEPDKPTNLIRLTQAGEDFVSLSNLLNYLAKKYQPLWVAFIVPVVTFIVGINWGSVIYFVKFLYHLIK